MGSVTFTRALTRFNLVLIPIASSPRFQRLFLYLARGTCVQLRAGSCLHSASAPPLVKREWHCPHRTATKRHSDKWSHYKKEPLLVVAAEWVPWTQRVKGLWTWVPSAPTMWPWISHFSPLSLRFLIFKMKSSTSQYLRFPVAQTS